MQLSNISEFWGVNLSSISLPCADKVKALIFDTFGTAQDCFIGEEEFDNLKTANEYFSNDPGCNDHMINSQTSKKVYIIDFAGKVIGNFGLI